MSKKERMKKEAEQEQVKVRKVKAPVETPKEEVKTDAETKVIPPGIIRWQEAVLKRWPKYRDVLITKPEFMTPKTKGEGKRFLKSFLESHE